MGTISAPGCAWVAIVTWTDAPSRPAAGALIEAGTLIVCAPAEPPLVGADPPGAAGDVDVAALAGRILPATVLPDGSVIVTGSPGRMLPASVAGSVMVTNGVVEVMVRSWVPGETIAPAPDATADTRAVPGTNA